MAFELEPFNIRIKTVSPGGITTDFATRSLVLTSHPAYEALVQRVMAVFRDPARAAHRSSAEQIAAVVYEAVTDGKDELRYLAGNDAKAAHAQRLAVGAEAFRKGIRTMFLG